MDAVLQLDAMTKGRLNITTERRYKGTLLQVDAITIGRYYKFRPLHLEVVKTGRCYIQMDLITIQRRYKWKSIHGRSSKFTTGPFMDNYNTITDPNFFVYPKLFVDPNFF